MNPERDLLWREIPALAAVLEACSDELPNEVKESLETTRQADRAGMSVYEYLERQRLARLRERTEYRIKRKRFTHKEIMAQKERNSRRDKSGRYVKET